MSGPVRKWSRPRGSGSASSPLVHEMAPLMTRGAGGVLHDEAESIRRRAFLSGAFVGGTVILMVVAGFLYDPFHPESHAPRADVSRDRSGQSEPTTSPVHPDRVTKLVYEDYDAPHRPALAFDAEPDDDDPATLGVVDFAAKLRPLQVVKHPVEPPTVPAAVSAAVDRARATVSSMTLDEKLSLLYGVNPAPAGPYIGEVAAVPRVGLPGMRLNDGPQGFRCDAHPGTTTQWPSALTVAASWSRDAMRRWAEAMGDEFAGKGANVFLGPGVNVARVPRNGRNFEYQSGEDPHLGAALVTPFVSGMQSRGVVAVVKHYLNNNQEENRFGVDAMVDERVQRELYLPPFEAAVRGDGVEPGAMSVMCAYNKVGGTYACENEAAIGVLREEFGFKGFVMSDWLATHSTAPAMRAGLDQEMPEGANFSPDNVRAAMQRPVAPELGRSVGGTARTTELDESDVDAAATRIVTAMEAVGAVAKGVAPTGNIAAQVATEETRALARELGAQATTMLKNAKCGEHPRPLLPLRRDAHRRVVVVGSPDPSGHGSGAVAPSDSVTVHRGIEAKLSPAKSGASALGNVPRRLRDGVLDAAVAGVTVSDRDATTTPSLGAEETTPDSESSTWARWYPVDAVGAAAEDARGADVVVVVVGTSSAESLDRANLELGADQNAAVRAMVSANPCTVVVVMTPGAVLMPWRDEVPAILVPFLPGEAHGHAVADVLFGDADPGGRLPITMPATEDDLGWTPEQYPGVDSTARYLEGLKVGYRGYDAKDVSPAYPFGFGLSYAGPFEYLGGEILDGAEEGAKVVTFDVRNAHETRAGYETSQVYLGFPSTAGEPPKQLRAFAKLAYGPGETRTLRVALPRRAMSVWDAKRREWRVLAGAYKVYVGSHARDEKVILAFNVDDE
jgi:beta-glucosidase